MMHLTPRWDIPIIPIVVNAFAPPMPSPRRCFDVGAFVGKCIERWPEKTRVAVLGTGGLSHWVGPPQTGRSMRSSISPVPELPRQSRD